MLVGYMRVSSADTDRQSVDLQRDALLAAGVDERHLHRDKASGARDDRPGLKACLDDLRPGDVLVVWKLDRLGRSLPHLLAIVGELRTLGVAFRSLTEQMDTTTPHGELLFSIFGALAQYERALTRERVVAGLAAAKRRGRRGGCPPALDPERVEQIVAALEGGASKAGVCRAFKVARSTLRGTLARVGWTGPAAPAPDHRGDPVRARPGSVPGSPPRVGAAAGQNR
jgi:DNA invertase Pin-like site-specific DNA recombinase